ncbi:MAG: hypothetical protein JO090_01165 [Rhizobacter sp.]|nr:hypothetical protein [Rhizobacter sp.]
MNAESLPLPNAAAPAYDRTHGVACAIASVVLGLTQSITVWGINNNLPALQGSLGATAVESSWLSTAYFATALSAVVPLTKLRLQFGLDRFATWGVALFTVASVGYLLAPSLAMAIAARAAMGLAATPLNTLAVLYMLEAFPAALAPVGALLGFGTLQLGSPLTRVLAQPLFDALPGTGLPMFDVSLALVAVATIHLVRLRPPPHQEVLNAGDLPAFALYASGLAFLCLFITQGRARWWTDTPWLGNWLCAGLACLGAYVVFDLWRERPLIDLRWLAGPTMRWFIPGVVLFRVGLSEQPSGTVALMNLLGYTNDEMRGLFAWVTLAIAVGFILVVVAVAMRSLRLTLLASLLLIVAGSHLDAGASSVVDPDDVLVSQVLIGLATAMFLGSSFVLGLLPVVLDGQRRIVSFLAVFVGAQYMGSLIGAAWLGTYEYQQQQLHLVRLVQSITSADPQVVLRAAQGAAAQAGVIVDPLLRNALGVSALSQRVAREAWVLAYGDAFRWIAYVAGAMFIVLGAYWSTQWWLQRARAAADVPSGAQP